MALEQQQRLTRHTLKKVFVDRGYQGRKEVKGTLVHTPKKFSSKLSRYCKAKLKQGFARRAAIEPKISHVKANHRLSRNFYKGIKGDDINIMLAAAAMNFKIMMNIWKGILLALFYRLVQAFDELNSASQIYFPNFLLTF